MTSQKTRGRLDQIFALAPVVPVITIEDARDALPLARALVADRSILLMDEPFGPLDAQTRLSLQQQLTQLWEEVKNTVVFVTHDVIEAIALSDLVVVLSARPGRILDVVSVSLPRPRDVLSVPDCEGFAELHARLQRLLLPEQT